MNRIVVLPGSFNPITKAHTGMLLAAVDKIHADAGLFLATNGKYLRRKILLKTKSDTNFILSEETRKEMIDSVTANYPNFSFCGYELGGITAQTYKSLKKVQKQYPNAELYFMVGTDKLKNLPRWNNIESLLKDFHVLIYSRNDMDIEEFINTDPILAEHKDRIVILEGMDDFYEVSSSEVRRRLMSGEDYSDLMDEAPYKILHKMDPSQFSKVTKEDLILANLEVGGRFGANSARQLVFKSNAELFHAWDEKLLGNRETKLTGTQVYREPFTVDAPKLSIHTMFNCVNADCADIAEEMLDFGLDPAILNLASNTSPGGGYHKGTSAQEESLCQMSTLSQSLYQFGDIKRKHIKEAGLPNITGVYPMDINFGGIYSPDVTFFRHNVSKKYALREKPFSCAVITVASLSNREKNDYTNDEQHFFNEDGTIKDDGREIEMNKIRTVFRIALDHNHDALVLGAFGCGVYNLLPEEVSSMFAEILEEAEFKDRFKLVVFAIYEGKPSARKSVGPDGKFKPFYDRFAL